MIRKTYLFLIIFCVLFISCFKTEIPPPLMFEGEANMSIADFQKLHTLDPEEPVTLIKDEIIITGIVTSTDKYGSCYKEIFFQDKTGGLSIRIDNSSYYNKYRIGQRIFVKAKGLYLGNYVSWSSAGIGRYGFYQLGLYANKNSGSVAITSKKENQHIFRHDIPTTRPIPKTISGTTDIVVGIGGDYHTLVRLANCYFIDADGIKKYFEPSGTLTTISQNIGFNNGTGTIQARISSFCTFANDLLPEGPLNITGILSMYESPPYSPYQLIICNIDDVQEFPREKNLKTFDMSTSPFDNGWKNVQITGTDGWKYYPESKHVRIQAKEGNVTEYLFVSPAFNFSGEKDVALAFNYRLPDGSGENAQVLYSVDGTTWIPFEYTVQKASQAITVYVKIEENIASNPNLQIAFKYKTTTTYPMWAINNISFKADVTM
ncbi:MAG: DUF5689 domain-containing protein [Bacteroidales bacterium]|jgi:hypothetical protein|nr:DUF5689 domain-containing protein [Bacteroidales bacterium]